MIGSKLLKQVGAGLLCPLVLFSTAQAVPPTPTPEPGHIEFPKLDIDNYEKEIVASLRVNVRNQGGKVGHSDEPVAKKPSVLERKELPMHWRTDSLVSLSSTMAVNLNFAPGTAKPDIKPFSVYVRLGEEDALIRTSRPRYSNHVGGITFNYPSRGVKSIFLDGLEGSGIFVMVPKVLTLPGNSVLLCPKEIHGQSLRETNVALSSVEFLPEAFASGAFHSEKPATRAIASILTSEGMPACSPFEDKHEAPISIVKLYCNPNTLGPAPKTGRRGEIDQLIGGVRSMVDMQAGWGGQEIKRVSSKDTRMFVRKVLIDFSTWAIVQKVDVRVDRGNCYIVGREITASERGY